MLKTITLDGSRVLAEVRYCCAQAAPTDPVGARQFPADGIGSSPFWLFTVLILYDLINNY